MDKVIEPQKIPEILEIRHVEMFANFIRTYNANKSSKIDIVRFWKLLCCKATLDIGIRAFKRIRQIKKASKQLTMKKLF